MTGTLAALLRRLAALAFLTACVDFLLPEGEARKYVRFAAGLALLQAALALLQAALAPVLRLVSGVIR